ncbi:MAG: hypothetical protein V3T38_06575, partial [Gammaproteobacteria bacterium]
AKAVEMLKQHGICPGRQCLVTLLEKGDLELTVEGTIFRISCRNCAAWHGFQAVKASNEHKRLM